MQNHFPIVYTFSEEDIQNQRLTGFLALFTAAAVARRETALALRNTLHLGFPSLGMKKARFENAAIRAFCKRLLKECPILPWVVGLSTPFYREVIYSVLPEIRVTYRDQKPGKYQVTYRVEDMDRVIHKQVKQIEKIGKTAGIYPVAIEARQIRLNRYLRDGEDLA
jgi:hypothetical protein